MGYGLIAKNLQNFLLTIEQLKQGLNLLLQDPNPYQYFSTECNRYSTHCYCPGDYTPSVNHFSHHGKSLHTLDCEPAGHV